MKKAGVQLYSLRNEAAADFPGLLKKVADIGYAGVEFAGYHGSSPGNLKKILDDLGLQACSSHVYPLPPENEWMSLIEDARTLGHHQIVSLKLAPDLETPEQLDQAAAEMQTAAEFFAGEGIELLYHNHWWEMEPFEAGEETRLDLLLKKAPAMKLQLDIYWAANFGKLNVPALINKYGERMTSFHAKDGMLEPGKGKPHLALGQGRMDIPACIHAADQVQALEWIIVELDRCATDMFEAVRESYAYLIQHNLATGTKTA